MQLIDRKRVCEHSVWAFHIQCHDEHSCSASRQISAVTGIKALDEIYALRFVQVAKTIGVRMRKKRYQDLGRAWYAVMMTA